MATKTKAKAPKTYAEARERLDDLLEALERDTADIDSLAARIKEASELIRFCRERLSSARQEVEQVVADLSAENEPGHGADAEADADEDFDDERPNTSLPPDGLPF